jgi:hypothetical protein
MSTATLPKVKVVCCCPPIPDRSSDYAAYDDDTYDGAPDAGAQVVGWGATEAEAVADFWEQWNEKYDERRLRS